MSDARDEWDFFYSKRGDAEASIMVNLGIRPVAPDRHRSWRLTVRLQIQAPTPKGMNTADERPKLDEIADALTDLIVTNCDAVFVGRMIRGGFWTLTYYAPSPASFLDSVDKTMKRFPGYPYGRGVREDPAWSIYLEYLTPTRREMRQILDRRVIDTLRQNGDDLTASREVFHWIYFQSIIDRSNFLESILGDGFQIFESELAEDGTGSDRVHVRLSRVDFVDLSSMHDLVLHLFDRAEEFGGEYDGWETVVVKSG